MKNVTTTLTNVFDRWAGFISIPLAGLVLALLMPTVSAAAATAPALGDASGFVVLASSAISDASGSTTLKGDVGLDTGTGTGITGLKASNVDGTIYSTDGAGPTGTVSNSSLMTSAKSDLTTAYDNAAGQTGVDHAVELGSSTLSPGVYSHGTFEINGTLTLDGGGDPNAVFIFQTTTTLTTGTNSNVILT